METFGKRECLNPATQETQPYIYPSRKNRTYGTDKALAEIQTGKEVKKKADLPFMNNGNGGRLNVQIAERR